MTVRPPDIAGAGGLLTVDLGALRANYLTLARIAAPAACGAVVKADAYGLDAAIVAPALAEAGCRHFFVAHLEEGLRLRASVPPEAAIVILNGLQPGGEEACAESRLLPVLNGLEQVEAWAALARRAGRRLPAVLQVDSGMSRLGLSPLDIDKLEGRDDLLEALDVRLVMSHLACADEPSHPANAAQRNAFERVRHGLPRACASSANSGGALLGEGFAFDLVRAGIALYGVEPAAGRLAGLRPVVRLDGRVIQVRDVPAGAGIGYGLAFTAARPTRIATIGVGYGDGWPRRLGGRGAAYRGDARLPIVGRVSMDSITLDVTDLPEGALRLGSPVELIGPRQTLDDVAAQAGTIPYEILTSLGRRYERRYVGAGPHVLSRLEAARAA